MKNTLVIVILLLLLSGCSLQKRRYQKGFYLSRQTFHEHIERKSEPAGNITQKSRAQDKVENVAVMSVLNDKNNLLLTASAEKMLKPVHPGTRPIIRLKNSPCDLLILLDGSELQVMIIETNAIEVKYKKCADQDDALYSAKKADLFMAKYADGTKELFNPEKLGQTPDISVPRTTHSMATLSLVFSITGFALLVGSIPAIILGSQALKRIKENPQEYRGRGQALAGLILGILGIVLKTLFVLLIIVTLII